MSKGRNEGAVRGRDTAISNGQSSGWKNGSNGTKYKSSRDGGGNVKHERVSSSGLVMNTLGSKVVSGVA